MSAERRAGGFTLLEVMIALAILALSLTALSRSQQKSVQAANRAKWMTVAVMLAREKMVEVEDTLFKEGFSDFKEEEKGDFSDQGFSRLTYTLLIEKIELPANVDDNAAANAIDEEMSAIDESQEKESPQSAMLSMGTQMMGQYYQMIRNTLEQSIRRVQLKIQWKEGSRTQEVSVVSYFTDSRKIGTVPGQ